MTEHGRGDGSQLEGGEVERIMRRAEELGHDPQRVARALRHAPPEAAERQSVMAIVRRRPVLARLLGRRLPRRS